MIDLTIFPLRVGCSHTYIDLLDRASISIEATGQLKGPRKTLNGRKVTGNGECPYTGCILSETEP